jgi:type I restriction enzyme S subunit
VSGKVWVHNHAHVLKTQKGYNRYYICNYLESLSYDKYNTGTAQPKLNREVCERISLLLPDIEEQNAISYVLTTWDVAIKKQSELIEKLILRKRALMQQLLTGKKRLPGFSGEWKRIKLDNIAERVTRKNEDDNRNVVTISAQRGFVVQTDFFNKSVASETLDNYFLVHKDEFCYNKSYSNGYPMGAIKRLKTFDKAVVTTLYICFRLKDKTSANIDFFEQYCESGIFNKELVKVANEGGRAHGLLNVTPSDFFNMHMSIPDIDEQNAIASVLVNAHKEIELANDKLVNLQSQKQGLMQQLLTGKKRIS